MKFIHLMWFGFDWLMCSPYVFVICFLRIDLKFPRFAITNIASSLNAGFWNLSIMCHVLWSRKWRKSTLFHDFCYWLLRTLLVTSKLELSWFNCWRGHLGEAWLWPNIIFIMCFCPNRHVLALAGHLRRCHTEHLQRTFSGFILRLACLWYSYPPWIRFKFPREFIVKVASCQKSVEKKCAEVSFMLYYSVQNLVNWSKLIVKKRMQMEDKSKHFDVFNLVFNESDNDNGNATRFCELKFIHLV